MKRTQLYLDDDLWNLLHFRARTEKTTVSKLACRAIRERYAGNLEKRAKAMEAVIGIWKDRTDLPDTEEHVRRLRRSTAAPKAHKAVAVLVDSDVLIGVFKEP